MADNAALKMVSAELAQLKVLLRKLYVQWCVSGPTLESSSALAAMAQEEAGHARILGRLADGAVATSDAGALLPIDEITSWPELVGLTGPVEIALAAILRELKGSDEQFARNLAKIAAEERHHVQFFLGWFEELEPADGAAGTAFREARQTSEQRVAAWLDGSQSLFAEAGVTGLSSEADDHEVVEVDDVDCIHCGSHDVARTAAFGASLMTSLMRCRSCGGQFEGVRFKQATA